MEWWAYGGLALLVLAVAVVGWQALRDLVMGRAKKRCVRRHGEQVLACVVEELRHLILDDGDIPVVALITFDRTVGDVKDYLEGLARRVWELKERKPASPEEWSVARLAQGWDVGPYERVELAPSFTGGRAVYVVRFTVYQRLLRRAGPTPPFVYCLASPDRPDVGVEMIDSAD
jgi:hypothetical protein